MTVTAGGKVVCVITVRAGRGTCTVNTAQFAAGSVKFTGTYHRATAPKSVTATTTVTLKKAPTTTRLSVSAASVTYGHEQSERLTVRVVPKFSGAPGGAVTVRAGSVVLCTITLRDAAGSCSLSPGKLSAGSYQLIATYPGDAGFAPSTSARAALSVSK